MFHRDLRWPGHFHYQVCISKKSLQLRTVKINRIKSLATRNVSLRLTSWPLLSLPRFVDGRCSRSSTSGSWAPVKPPSNWCHRAPLRFTSPKLRVPHRLGAGRTNESSSRTSGPSAATQTRRTFDSSSSTLSSEFRIVWSCLGGGQFWRCHVTFGNVFYFRRMFVLSKYVPFPCLLLIS